MNYEEMKAQIQSEAALYFDEICRLNDDIADHPELSGLEYETSKKIVEFLRSRQYDVVYPFNNMATAFKATYGRNHHHRKIALLAEYDALPEIGHACGHSAICSISILAAFALAMLQDQLDADIHIIGTPAEETYGGKCIMVEDGVFDQYDFAILVHPNNFSAPSANLLALDSAIYDFCGKASHAAAAPWEGNNALNAARLLFDSVDMFRQHVKPDVRIHGVINSGGVAANIVPDYSQVSMYTRSSDRYYLNEITKKVDTMAQCAAMMTGCTFKKTVPDKPFDNLKGNPVVEDVISDTFAELKVPFTRTDTLFGSSDIGNVSFRCPAFHPVLKVSDAPIHTAEFAAIMKSDTLHSAICTGALLISYTIVKIFSNPALYEEMLAQFK